MGEVTCTVPNSDRKLLPNINVGVTITTVRHENALTVPREAIHQEDGKRFVFQIVKDELKRREVQTSVFKLTKIEDSNGLGDGDLVALGSTNSVPLKPNMTVEVVER